MMISLDEVVLAFESIMSDDDLSVDVYYDPKSQTIEYVADDDGEEYDDFDEIDLDDEDWIYLTTDLDDRSIVNEFVNAQDSPELSKMVRLVFHGKNKLVKVKEVFADFGILEAYDQFRDHRITEEAKHWLKENHIAYSDK